jgi:hypothetical protein
MPLNCDLSEMFEAAATVQSLFLAVSEIFRFITVIEIASFPIAIQPT